MNLYENISTSLTESIDPSTYTKIVREIDDVCFDSEDDPTSIQLFLQNIINHCKDTAETFDVSLEENIEQEDN